MASPLALNPFNERALSSAYNNIVGSFIDKADYNAARPSRFRRRRSGIPPVGANADYHYRNEPDFLRIMEWARDYDRNDVVVGQAIDRVCRNIIQDGFTPDPQIKDSGLRQALKDRWYAWADDPRECDIRGRSTFADMLRLALRHSFVDGDLGMLPLETGHLQAIEAHRIRTPRNTRKNCIHGVMLNSTGRPTQYWVTKDDIGINGALRKVSDVIQYPAWDDEGNHAFFHINYPKRFSQTRGISRFTPIFDAIGMHDDLQFAKLLQAQMVSCFAIIRQRSEGFQGSGNPQRGPRTTETLADGSTRMIEGVSPAMEVASNPGEKIEGFSPNVPNAEFFSHASLILTFIFINLDLPLHVGLLDPTKTNFSGWRGALDEARKRWREFQQWMLASFVAPVFRWKVRQWIEDDEALARGVEAAGGAKMFVHWQRPRWEYIEPLKDTQTDNLQKRTFLNSPRRIFANKGEEYRDIIGEALEDNAELIAGALEWEQKLYSRFPGLEDRPDRPTFRDILAPPIPDTISASQTASKSESVVESDESDKSEEPAGAAA